MMIERNSNDSHGDYSGFYSTPFFIAAHSLDTLRVEVSSFGTSFHVHPLTSTPCMDRCVTGIL